MSETFVMDTIATNKKTYVGVIDFSTTKHIMFYDLTNNNDPDLITMVILWRSYYSDMRFSVFKATYCDNIDIGSPIMINKKTIKNEYRDIKNVKPKMQVIESITIESLND